MSSLNRVQIMNNITLLRIPCPAVVLLYKLLRYTDFDNLLHIKLICYFQFSLSSFNVPKTWSHKLFYVAIFDPNL